MRKLTKMIKDLVVDYRNTPDEEKWAKKACYKKVVSNIGTYVWSIITAPVIYPIYYVFRKYITANVNKNKFTYWLWTYGDMNDPLGWGGMPHDYRNGKNNFINRYWFSAIRNPRFTINYIKFMTNTIVREEIAIDTRDFNIMWKSYGVGDLPNGVIFDWFFDDDDNAWFIYENNTRKSAFWFGYVGLLNDHVWKQGRFEIAYRKSNIKKDEII